MADLPHYPGTDDDIGAGSDRRSTTGRPWWVYAVWLVGIALIVLFVALHLTGAIGPGSH